MKNSSKIKVLGLNLGASTVSVAQIEQNRKGENPQQIRTWLQVRARNAEWIDAGSQWYLVNWISIRLRGLLNRAYTNFVHRLCYRHCIFALAFTGGFCYNFSKRFWSFRSGSPLIFQMARVISRLRSTLDYMAVRWRLAFVPFIYATWILNRWIAFVCDSNLNNNLQK